MIFSAEESKVRLSLESQPFDEPTGESDFIKKK